MSDLEKLQEYIEAKGALEKAYTLVRNYGQIIGDVERYINCYPYKMTMSNTGVSFIVAEEREYTLNGDEWPTAKQLATALSDYLNKRIKARHLYDSLSDSQKSTIQPHPNI